MKVELESLELFQADMVVWNKTEEFLIVTGDHNTTKGREFFGQREQAYNNAIEKAAEAGYKLVVNHYEPNRWIRYANNPRAVGKIIGLPMKIKRDAHGNWNSYDVASVIDKTWDEIMV
ncbi:MAG: hypothetical protein QMD50_00620 [Patescibacteria group bacterium]|nr:hypothetical protein [Patescibacteria group bacterium]